MPAVDLDLLVIGSGPSGQKAAIQAAKLGKRVAVAERRDRLGGVSIHTGTIPSKTLREAVLDQLSERPLDVLDPTRMEETEQQALQQLMDRAAHVIAAETAVVREQFRRNMVGWLPGDACIRGRSHRPDRRLGRADPRRPDRDRRRHDACPARDGRLRRPHDHRLRRPAADGAARAAQHDRGRRRRDRRRVRVDVRRARHEGHGRRPARPRARLPRRRDRRGVPVPAAPQQRDVPAAGEGRGDRVGRRPRPDPARLGQGAQLRDRPLRRRPPGRDVRARGRAHGSGGRQARAAARRRAVPHVGAAHLRGRRRGGRRARRDRDGAGPARGAVRVRPARPDAARPDPDRRLRDPRDRHGRRARRSSSPTPRTPTSSGSRAGPSSPAG